MADISRRNALKSLAGVSALGLAGCLGSIGGSSSGEGDGNGGGGSTSLAVGVPGSSTTTGQASQAFQRVVSEESETISWNTQETGGDPASIRQYDQGNLDAFTAGNFVLAQAMADQPPFEEQPVESLPYQGFMIATLHLHWMAVEGSGIETTDDLIGKNVWPLPPSWGLRQMTEAVLKNAGVWEDIEPNVVDADTGDIAGAIEEGRVDAIVAYGANYVNLPGWATEVDARANLHSIEVTDQFKEGINKTAGTSFQEVDTYGWEQDVGSDTMGTWPSAFQFHFAKDMSVDVGYELAKLSHDHYEQVREGQPSYLDHSKFENMTDGYLPDAPVHPGVADFLKENDAWNDDWTRGEPQA
ncbi:TAXI family TRAP transporter solute-binding subunit [Haladaptatus sp. CMSO5]|uniref:TAXI family TRAP transporter solute-binding subunit n=1 Tax=Haladaptatus sp. CMSO5 TaxID=3120514 RepID=UPI002FCDF890